MARKPDTFPLLAVIVVLGCFIAGGLILANCAGQPDSNKHTMTFDDYDDIRQMLQPYRGN